LETSAPSKRIARQKAFVVDTLLVASIGLAFAIAAHLLPMRRVGDGSEYYAMYYAWLVDHRPFVSPTSIEAYSRFAAIHPDAGLLPAFAFRFPELRVGSTYDFNHFSFYSGLAAIVGVVRRGLGLGDDAHASFIALHALLISTVAITARRLAGANGVIAALALAVLSPIVWYVDKAHSELFTFACVTMAAMAVTGGRTLLAAIPLAIASTQNPPFAVIAGGVVAIEAMKRRSVRPLGSDLAILGIVAVFATLHPLYYWSRYGTISPQLLAGGATPFVNLRYAYAFVLDLDIGLLPNWLLGSALLVWVVRAGRASFARVSSGPWFSVFAAMFLLVALAAQSSTWNMNSGGTAGPARYGLWFVGLWFPVALAYVDHVVSSSRARVFAIPLLAVAAIHTAVTVGPWRPESYDRATLPSRIVQRYASRLYDPPPEVFADRYGRVGEAPALRGYAAVVGPDCTKTLLLRSPALTDGVLALPRCIRVRGGDDVLARDVRRLARATTTFPVYRRLRDPARR